MLCQFQSIHKWHLNITDHQIRMHLLHQFQCFFPILCHSGHTKSKFFPFNSFFHSIQDLLFIVCQNNTKYPHGSSPFSNLFFMSFFCFFSINVFIYCCFCNLLSILRLYNVPAYTAIRQADFNLKSSLPYDYVFRLLCFLSGAINLSHYFFHKFIA